MASGIRTDVPQPRGVRVTDRPDCRVRRSVPRCPCSDRLRRRPPLRERRCVELSFSNWTGAHPFVQQVADPGIPAGPGPSRRSGRSPFGSPSPTGFGDVAPSVRLPGAGAVAAARAGRTAREVRAGNRVPVSRHRAELPETGSPARARRRRDAAIPALENRRQIRHRSRRGRHVGGRVATARAGMPPGRRPARSRMGDVIRGTSVPRACDRGRGRSWLPGPRRQRRRRRWHRRTLAGRGASWPRHMGRVRAGMVGIGSAPGAEPRPGAVSGSARVPRR